MRRVRPIHFARGRDGRRGPIHRSLRCREDIGVISRGAEAGAVVGSECRLDPVPAARCNSAIRTLTFLEAVTTRNQGFRYLYQGCRAGAALLRDPQGERLWSGRIGSFTASSRARDVEPYH